MRKKYIVALLAVGLCWYPVFGFSQIKADAVNLSDESSMTEEEQKIKEYCDIIVNAVNDERVAEGLSELATFPLLNEVTCIRAEELEQSFTHIRPGGDMCFTALKDAGIKYSVTAENIAAGRSDPVATVEQWMNSEGHRKNILGESYTHVGIGYYYCPGSKYEYYWSMFLIGTYSSSEPAVFDGQYYPERSLGDVDGSHVINASDASKILAYAAKRAAGIDVLTAHGFTEAADVNSDGIIDARDASAILSYSAALGAGYDAELTDYIW